MSEKPIYYATSHKQGKGKKFMAEQEYIIGLCTSYSREELIKQRKKIDEGTAEAGLDMIDAATADELDRAIADYENEEYRCIREKMYEDWKKYGLI